MRELYDNYISDHAGEESLALLSRILARDLIPWLPPDNPACLDLGCGQGGLSALLRRSGYTRAFGIDISPEQVLRARELGRSFVQRGDLREYLTRSSSEWDVITAFDLLEHLPRDLVLETFVGVHHALMPGGIFVARLPNGASPLSGEIRYGDFTHQSTFTARSITQLAKAAGFTGVTVREVKPLVDDPMSATRRVVWSVCSGAIRVALAAETGTLRGHHVSSNIMVYIYKGH